VHGKDGFFFSDCHHAQTNLGLLRFFLFCEYGVRNGQNMKLTGVTSTSATLNCVYYLHAPYTPLLRLTFRHHASSIEDRRSATLQRRFYIYFINKYTSLYLWN